MKDGIETAPESNHSLRGQQRHLPTARLRYTGLEGGQELLAHIERTGGRDIRLIVDPFVERAVTLAYFRTDREAGCRVPTVAKVTLTFNEAAYLFRQLLGEQGFADALKGELVKP